MAGTIEGEVDSVIYITGDTHGEIGRFCERNMPGESTWGEQDKLIICGDFGFVFATEEYEGAMRQERWKLDRLEQKPYQILFVAGNHENFDRLQHFEQVTLYGGSAVQIRSNIFMLKRGELYEIEGKKIFAMGGAYSTDRWMRIPYQSWWPQELPDNEEYHHAIDTLEQAGKIVDIVITHTAPQTIIRMLGHVPDPHDLELTGFLEWMMHEVHFRKWYFGHWHVDQEVTLKITACWFDVHDIV